MTDYAIEGDGETIIILHGSYGGKEQARLLGEPLKEEGFRTISLSRPGYPGTPLKEGKTAEEQADLINSILEKEDIDQTHIYAYSAGGQIGIEMARKYPEKIKKTVMDSAVVSMECSGSQMPDRLFLNNLTYHWPLIEITDLGLRLITYLFPEATFRMSSNSEPDEDDLEQFKKILETTFPLDRKKKGIKNDFRITRSSQNLPESLETSILLINYAELDKIEKTTEVLEKRYEDVQREVLAGGGHMSWMQNDPRKKEKILRFLE